MMSSVMGYSKIRNTFHSKIILLVPIFPLTFPISQLILDS